MLSRTGIKTEIQELDHVIGTISKQVASFVDSLSSPGLLFLSMEVYNNHKVVLKMASVYQATWSNLMLSHVSLMFLCLCL